MKVEVDILLFQYVDQSYSIYAKTRQFNSPTPQIWRGLISYHSLPDLLLNDP